MKEARKRLAPVDPGPGKIARALGYSPQRYSNYESGLSDPPHADLPRLAGILQVTVDYMLGLESLEAARSKQQAHLRPVAPLPMVPVPVIGLIRGGRGESMGDEAESPGEHVYIPVQFSGDRIAATLLQGDSMAPYLMPGDTLIFELSPTPRPGRVSAIRISPGEIICKEMRWDQSHPGGGGWSGISWNSAYAPVPIARENTHLGILIGYFRSAHGDELYRRVASGLRRGDIPLVPDQ